MDSVKMEEYAVVSINADVLAVSPVLDVQNDCRETVFRLVLMGVPVWQTTAVPVQMELLEYGARKGLVQWRVTRLRT